MKNSIVSIALLLSLSIANSTDTVSQKASSTANQSQRLVEQKIFNAYCPVTGEKVNPKVHTVMYKGKRIGFCCPGCEKTFLKDPEKALKNISPDGQKWISKQAPSM